MRKLLRKLWMGIKNITIYDEVEDVRRFHRKFGLMTNDGPVHLTRRKLRERLEFLQEEVNEFADAVKAQDLPDLADALVDIVYVAKGTAVMLGLPWEELWDEVQRANMDKIRGIGKRGHLVDCIKPPDWQPPMILQVLKENGYDFRKFSEDRDMWKIDEGKCHDDVA